MTIRLRHARPGDHAPIAGLVDLSGSTRRLLAADLAGHLPRHVVVAIVDRVHGVHARRDQLRADRVVGMGMTTRQPDEVHLLDLVVQPSHRRRGIATLLLADLARRARADGATAMTLEVRASNTAGRALYAARGFVDRGVRPGYYRDGEDARILGHADVDLLAATHRAPARGRIA